MSKARSRTAQQKPVGFLVYMGPSIHGVIRHGAICKNGVLPPKARHCVREFPVMNRLFVGEKDMPAAVTQISKQEGVFWTIYQKTAQKFS